MARPTRLKVLGSREVPSDIAGQADPRSVVEAFPRPPSPPETGSTLAEDILEVLRKSHARMSGEVQQATAVASAAIEQAQAANASLVALSEKTAAIETTTARIGETVIGALNEKTDAKIAARQAVTAASLGVLQRLGERLTNLATFAIDRAPAFLALGAACWLWSDVLANPTMLQLGALGLFGGVVVAPAIWLSSRRA